MSKSNNHVPDLIKHKIVKAFAEKQATVRQLSEEYNLSRTTIYNWIRRQSQSSIPATRAKENGHPPQVKRPSISKSKASLLSSESKPSFMELSISPENPPQNNLSIKKVFIDFEDFSLSIDSSHKGSFSKDRLVAILDIMEA